MLGSRGFIYSTSTCSKLSATTVKELWNEAVSCTMNMPEKDNQEKRIYEACMGRQMTSPHAKICWFPKYSERK